MARESKPGWFARLWRRLGMQSTGVVLALLSAALMAAGSFIMDRSPEAYRGLALDDLRFFFAPWRWQHAWFYALVLSLGLWAASALVCTWDSLASRIRRRLTRPSAYGAPLVHLTFVLALLTHLLGGLTASSSQAILSSSEVALHGASWRVLHLDERTWPSGMPRSVTVTLERTQAGRVQQETLGYNEPITSGLGTHEMLLSEAQLVPDGLLIRHKGQLVTVRAGMPSVAAGDAIVLRRFHDPRTSATLRVPVAELQVAGRNQMLPLEPDSNEETAFVGMSESPGAVVHVRDNPSVPMVLLVAVLLIVGVALVAWERARSSSGA